LRIDFEPTPEIQGGMTMNRIIYIIGLVVVVLFVAGYVGLR
jgi:hypothetical protein